MVLVSTLVLLINCIISPVCNPIVAANDSGNTVSIWTGKALVSPLSNHSVCNLSVLLIKKLVLSKLDMFSGMTMSGLVPLANR